MLNHYGVLTRSANELCRVEKYLIYIWSYQIWAELEHFDIFLEPKSSVNYFIWLLVNFNVLLIWYFKHFKYLFSSSCLNASLTRSNVLRRTQIRTKKFKFFEFQIELNSSLKIFLIFGLIRFVDKLSFNHCILGTGRT